MQSFKKFDFYLLLPVVFLLGISIASVGSVAAENLPAHLLYLAVGLVFFLIFSFLDSSILISFSPFIYIFCVLFLITPFIFGTATRGSMRWIPISGYTIQPSEIIKPFVAIVSAWFWSSRRFSVKNLVIYTLLSLPILFLIFLSPDLGSTLVVALILAGALVFSGITKKQLLVLVLTISVLLPFFWFTLKDYQKLRAIHFLNPYSDPLGEGYNLIQAKIAVGSGSLYGRGFGRGTQSHLAFLPERHTDFIFASISEELGFIGSSLLIILFLLLLLKILRIAKQQTGKSFFLLAIGLFMGLSFQTFVNIAMNIGLLPITGVTLPLVSYGGSSLLSSMIILGILENLSGKSRQEEILEIR